MTVENYFVGYIECLIDPTFYMQTKYCYEMQSLS
jgi:hypothetical protein